MFSSTLELAIIGSTDASIIANRSTSANCLVETGHGCQKLLNRRRFLYRGNDSLRRVATAMTSWLIGVTQNGGPCMGVWLRIVPG